MEKIVIATRASELALWQANYIKEKIENNFNIKVELNKIVSKGDKILNKPLALVGGKGHFTKELEDAMLAGRAHMAVHSLKDVPTFIPKGLKLSAFTKREDQSDIFLSYKYKSLDELPKNAVVGTTSLRRRMQLLLKRPDLKVKDLRGNVNTRLKKLKEGEFDAIILAYIGLKRLDLLKDIPNTQKLDFIPPMGQAALAIEIVEGNNLLDEISEFLNDDFTYKCTIAERNFIKKIGAGCSAPVAVNATIKDNKIKMVAMIGYADGSKVLKEKLVDDIKNFEKIGYNLADIFIEKEALTILAEAERLAFKEIRPDRI